MIVLPEKTPDVHLEAHKLGRRINQILEKFHEIDKFDPAFEAEIAQTIRFFGKNVAKLQECNESIIKLAGIFMCVKDTFVKWRLRDMNAFLLLIVTLLLKRREEGVIRQVSLILIEFAKCLPETQLKSLARFHSKPIMLIFHKISKLSTLYTQSKLLEILNIVASVLDDKGAKIIKQERIIGISSPEIAEVAFTLFKNIQRDNFLDSSRQFLKFYNEKIVKEPHVYSIEGFLIGMNDTKSDKAGHGIIVDFNLRNLSISFFTNGNQWRDSEGNQEAQHFFELEDCDVEAFPFKFQDPDHVEVILKPSRCHVLDKNERTVDDLPRIQSVLLVISNKNNSFMWKVLPSFKEKTPMHNDNNMTDQESIVSFQTMTTSVGGDVRIQSNANLTFDVVPNPVPEGRPKNPIDRAAAVDVSQRIPETLPVTVQEGIAPEKMLQVTITTQTQLDISESTDPFPSEPPKKIVVNQRQTAKIVPSYNNVSNPFAGTPLCPKFVDYDDIPQVDQILPLNQFMSHQRNIRRRKMLTGEQQIQLPEATYVIPQPTLAKKPLIAQKKSQVLPPPLKEARKPAKPRQAANKTLDYSTDEENHSIEIKEAFEGKRKRAAAKKMQIIDDDSDEEVPMKKTCKRQSPAAKKKPTPSPAITKKKKDEPKPKVMPKVAPQSIPAKKSSGNKTQLDMFEKLKQAEMINVKKSLAQPKPAPVVLPPRTIVKTTKRKALNDISNQEPPVKKPVDFGKLLKVANAEAAKPPITQRRVSFNDNVHVVNCSFTGSNALEDEFDLFIHREVEPKRQNRVEPVPQQKTVIVKSAKQQAEISGNGTKSRQQQPPKPQKAQLPKPKVQQEFLQQQLPKRRQVNEPNELNNGNPANDSLKHKFKEPQQQRTDVVYNYDAVKKNGILDMFLADTMSVDQETVDFDDSLDENLHIRTQTVHKKMSPTTIRSVQIKEINLMPSSPVAQNMKTLIGKNFNVSLANALMKKGQEAFQPLVLKTQILLETKDTSASSEAKSLLKQAVGKSRESKVLFKDHVQDHLKLLKRLHHSKRKMTQLYDQDQENMTNLKTSLKTVLRNTRSACKEKMLEIEKIRQSALFVEKEVKSSIWKKHLDIVGHQMQQVLQKNYEI